MLLFARRLRKTEPRISGEVHPAFFTRSAVLLHVPAGGAFEEQGFVAQRAELHAFRIRAAATRTDHSFEYSGKRSPAERSEEKGSESNKGIADEERARASRSVNSAQASYPEAAGVASTVAESASSVTSRRAQLQWLSPTGWWILAGWAVFVGSYALASLVASPGPRLTTFGDVMQCLAPLYAIAGLLRPTASANWRHNGFWMALGLGCAMWMAGQLLWTFVEVVQGQQVPTFFFGDTIIFLHQVPMIGALTLMPHEERVEQSFRHSYLDFGLLLVWCLYLYLFVVLPWEYAVPKGALYSRNYTSLATVEELVVVIGFAVLVAKARGGWRTVYGHLFGAASLYAAASVTINLAIDRGSYYTGSFYDVPLVASFVWFGSAGFVANEAAPISVPVQSHWRDVWAARFAMAAAISMPMLGLWSLWGSGAPQAVRDFRLAVTQVALIAAVALVALRQRKVDRDRLRLLQKSQESLESLQRVQAHLVQQEKLASLGQLAAGAAHEINNPLTGIVGYTELLLEDATIGDRPRALVGKIRDQARRIKGLVGSLLRFARRVPTERTLLDVNEVLKNAMNLSSLDLRGKNIRIEAAHAEELPGVRGDANQLLQVFFNVIGNAIDALEEVGGGLLTVRTAIEQRRVVVEISDTGPGIKDPRLVFDPFYTTKPVGKGTGLGLSICYGIVQEHGGRIFCYNRPEGGAAFRIELPTALEPLLLAASLAAPSSAKSSQ